MSKYMAYNSAINYVNSRLSVPAILGQLAEEAAELGKAALKLQRILMDENPTPVTEPEALRKLIEEMADAVCSIDFIRERLEINYSEQILPRIYEKGERWADRVWEKYDEPVLQAKKGEGNVGTTAQSY